ncbi:MAG: ribosome recycling factor [Firmicutes bacterium]|nr:ribosome recycling factor [Bacillota bacterium]
MKKTVEIFGHELAGMRAGRAHPALLEKVPVEYYGTPTPLQHLATISAPEPRTLVVQPFDRGAIGAIEKAILKADLGVSVRVDGNVVRVAVPPLTEERRRELVRQVKRRAEEEKVAVRNIRREAVDALRAAEKENQLSEDERRRAEGEVQKLTDRYTKEIDQLAEARERDILTP